MSLGEPSELEASTPHVGDQTRLRPQTVDRAGERVSSLVLAGEHPDLQPGRLTHALHQLAAVLTLANGRGRHGNGLGCARAFRERPEVLKDRGRSLDRRRGQATFSLHVERESQWSTPVGDDLEMALRTEAKHHDAARVGAHVDHRDRALNHGDPIW